MSQYFDNFKKVEHMKRTLRGVMAQIVGLMPGVRYESLYFAGGCFYSMWVGEDPNDFDVFARTEQAAAALRAWADDNESKIDQQSKWAFRVGKLNFVTAVYGNPSVVTGGFDFEHTRAWWSSGFCGEGNAFGTNLERLAEMWNRKRLIPNTAGCPNIQQWRVEKFLKRGWELDSGELDGLLLLAAASADMVEGDDYGGMTSVVTNSNPVSVPLYVQINPALNRV